MAGTKIYVHKKCIFAEIYGNIHINGTVDQPVIIRGDHLESFFDADYAQWDRILINEGTQDNLIENAIISHAAIGLEMDILQEFLGNKTIVNNTIIKDNKLYGVLCHAANLEMNNCQVSNNGTYSPSYTSRLTSCRAFTYCRFSNNLCFLTGYCLLIWRNSMRGFSA